MTLDDVRSHEWRGTQWSDSFTTNAKRIHPTAKVSIFNKSFHGYYLTPRIKKYAVGKGSTGDDLINGVGGNHTRHVRAKGLQWDFFDAFRAIVYSKSSRWKFPKRHFKNVKQNTIATKRCIHFFFCFLASLDNRKQPGVAVKCKWKHANILLERKKLSVVAERIGIPLDRFSFDICIQTNTILNTYWLTRSISSSGASRRGGRGGGEWGIRQKGESQAWFILKELTTYQKQL